MATKHEIIRYKSTKICAASMYRKLQNTDKTKKI